MPDMSLRKTLTGFVPADERSVNSWRRFKLNQVYRGKVTMPRNYTHHCLFMVLLEKTFQNQEKYDNEQMFRRAIALEAGHVEQTITLDGEVHLTPLSYSYDEIPDEADFVKAFAEAMAVCARILHGANVQELKDEVLKYAAEHYGVAA